jgi:integrase
MRRLPTPTTPPLSPTDIAGRARAYALEALSPNTRRAYAGDWAHFEAWCDARRLASLPAEPATVLAFLVEEAERVSVATLERRLSGIRQAHAAAGAGLDTSHSAFRSVWRGLRRVHGEAPRQKEPLLTEDLLRVISALPVTPAGDRDRALLLIGFAGGLRRSELASLDVRRRPGSRAWIEAVQDGLLIHFGRSKGDQEARGERIAIPRGRRPATCPVRACEVWIDVAGIDRGPLFRAVSRHGAISRYALTDRSIARIIQAAIARAARGEGLSQAQADARSSRYGGHSLRAGLATSAAARGASPDALRRQLRHKSLETTMRYIREGQLFQKNAASIAGL